MFEISEKTLLITLVVFTWMLLGFSVFSFFFKRRFPRIHKFYQSRIMAIPIIIIFVLISVDGLYFHPELQLWKSLLGAMVILFLLFIFIFLFCRNLGKRYKKKYENPIN